MRLAALSIPTYAAAAAALTLSLALIPPTSAAQAQEVATTSQKEVCAITGRILTYSRVHRKLILEEDRRIEFERAGIPWTLHRLYVLDHIVPLCLGGADTELNRHPQALGPSRAKDRAEMTACRLVCHNKMSLQDAQKIFLNAPSNIDWSRILTTLHHP
jgi:hypothetical protein